MVKRVVIGLVAFLALATGAFGARMVWMGKTSPEIENKNLGTRNGHLNVCGNKPNCVSSAAAPDSDFYIEPLTSENIEGLWDDLILLIQGLEKEGKGFKVVNIQDSYIHLTFTSRIFGFVDDVEFLLLPEQQIIEMRSESRLGYSDLGANRKRMEKFRGLLQPKTEK